jgi:hypothetical protein
LKIQTNKKKTMKVKQEGIMSIVSRTGWFCFLLSILLYGCSNTEEQSAEKIIQASLDAIGTRAHREKIQNLVSLADCISPTGKYTTEIHTASGGYSYFKQVYSYKPKPFEAVIENRDSGFITGDTLMRLSKETISVIRGHEFQSILLEMDKRFHDFEKPEKIDIEGVNVYRVKVKDELHNGCLLFFELKTGLLCAIHAQNPADPKEMIATEFSRWRKQQELLLPTHIAIKQGEKRYSFDFIKIVFNSPDFKKFPIAIKIR